MNHFSYLTKTSELYLFEKFDWKIWKIGYVQTFFKNQTFSKFFGTTTN